MESGKESVWNVKDVSVTREESLTGKKNKDGSKFRNQITVEVGFRRGLGG